MADATLRTNSAVYSVSLVGNTVDLAKYSVATGAELTGDETTYNTLTVAQKRFEATLATLLEQGAVEVSAPATVDLTPEQDIMVENALDYIYGEDDNVSESFPTTVTFGSGRLEVRVPIVEKPEGARVTGSKTVDGHRVALGSDEKGKQVAWIVE